MPEQLIVARAFGYRNAETGEEHYFTPENQDKVREILPEDRIEHYKEIGYIQVNEVPDEPAPRPARRRTVKKVQDDTTEE